MPSFRDLTDIPETLRILAPTESGHPAPVDDPPADLAVVDCAVYVDGQRLEGSCSYPDARNKVAELRLTGQEAFAWVGLHAPTEHQMQEVGDVFGLHPLAIEDAVLAHQRPKLERYDDMLFLVLKTVNYVQHESLVLTREVVETGEVMVFVSARFRGDSPAR